MEVDRLRIEITREPSDNRTAAKPVERSGAIFSQEARRESFSPVIFDDTDVDPGVGGEIEDVAEGDDVANEIEGSYNDNSTQAKKPNEEGTEARGVKEEEDEENGGGMRHGYKAEADAAYRGTDKAGANESGANTTPGWAIIGTKVCKAFGDTYYEGKVTSFDTELGFYRVVYNDGDDEDLDLSEVLAIAIPLGGESGAKKKRGRKRKIEREKEGDWITKWGDEKRKKSFIGSGSKDFEVKDLPDWLPEGWRVTEKSKKRVSIPPSFPILRFSV